VPPKRYPVPLNELILDREADIRKGVQHACHERFPGADAAKGFRDTGDVDNTIRRESRVGYGYVAAVETLYPNALMFHQGRDRHVRPLSE
jgi:hypothetical protein